MSYGEHEGTLPYNTDWFSDWARANGIDPSNFSTLYQREFLVAKVSTKELAREFLLQQEVEAALPLAGATLDDSPVQKHRLREPDDDPTANLLAQINQVPDWDYDTQTLPKEYRAPEGMAFQITIQPEVFADYYDEDERDGLEAFTFVGEYLHVTTDTDSKGVVQAEVHVRGNVRGNLGHVLLGVGNWFNGPMPEDVIPLPPSGAFSFVRHSDAVVSVRSDEHSAPYELCDVELVPFEKPVVETVYNPPAPETPDGIKLTDFIFYPNQEEAPHGFISIPMRGGGMGIIAHPTSFLALPHIDGDLRDRFWEDHKIMLRWTSAHDRERIELDLSRLSRADYQLRRYNSLVAQNQLFRRYFVVHDPGTGISVDALAKAVLAKEYLTAEELDEELRVRRFI